MGQAQEAVDEGPALVEADRALDGALGELVEHDHGGHDQDVRRAAHGPAHIIPLGFQSKIRMDSRPRSCDIPCVMIERVGQERRREGLRDERRWRAVRARDRTFDGAFVFGVRSTGIYCRPSCPARRPLRRNVVFFPVAEAAEGAGSGLPLGSSRGETTTLPLPTEMMRRHDPSW